MNVTNLTTASTTTDATSYPTASVAPTADALVVVGVQIGVTSGSPVISVAGLGLTWTLEDKTTTVAGGRTLAVFSAETGGSAPTPGAITISTGGVTANAALWNVAQVTGYDPVTPVAQTVNSRPAAGTSCSVPFASGPGAGNIRYACVGIAVAEQPAVGSGWTALGAGQTVTNLVNGFRAMYSDPAQTNITASWTTSSQPNVVGVEINDNPTQDATNTGTPGYSGHGSVSGVAAVNVTDVGTPAVLARGAVDGTPSAGGSTTGTPAASTVKTFEGTTAVGTDVQAGYSAVFTPDGVTAANATSVGTPGVLAYGIPGGGGAPSAGASTTGTPATVAIPTAPSGQTITSYRYQWWDGAQFQPIYPLVWDGAKWLTNVVVTVIPDDTD